MEKNSFIWEVQNSPYNSPFLSGTQTFGHSSPLYIVDQYEGKRPALINEKFISQREISFKIYPSALLDSNVLDAIDKKILTGKSLDGLDEFLNFITVNNWDSSPMFYYLEHFTKSKLEDFLPNAIRRTESLLRLHSMDDAHFIKTREIIPNHEAVNHYIDELGVRTLREVAEYRVIDFANSHKRRFISELI